MAGLSIELPREEVQAEREMEPMPSTGCKGFKQRNKAFSLHSEVTEQAIVLLATQNGFRV